MKKVFAIVLVLSLLLCCAACGEANNNAAGGNIEGSLTDLIAKVTKDATDPEMALIEVEVTEDMFSWYLFIDPIDGAEAMVSEPMIGSIPHSVVLLRVPDSVDAEAVRGEIEEKLDPRKWVCVEAEKTAVLRRGNLILMVMSDTETTDKIISNFSALS